jgi:F0F1-type ATP synthase membrane subunit c/vacuolar-type H+-ATPase subunit K
MVAESPLDAEFDANPYAPTTASANIQDELTRELVEAQDAAYVPSSLQWTAFRWFSICTLSAVPSFLVGFSITNGRYDAMLTGIVIFSVGYTLLDYGTSQSSWRRKKLIRRTLRTMYGTRIAITILFPIGYFFDLWCGLISIGLTQAITGAEFTTQQQQTSAFRDVLLTTLIQGSAMNVVLGVYGVLVMVLLGVVSALRR